MMHNIFKRRDRQFDMIISELAEIVLTDGLTETFRFQARELSVAIAPKEIQRLKIYFHKPPPEPKLYDFREHGLGGWLSACQFSIFEIVYNIGAPALPFLRKIAWGEYDWTQGNAIEILIRLAANGVQRDVILKEIMNNFPHLRYEATLYAIEPLLPYLGENKNLSAIFVELQTCEEFAEAYEELIECE